MTINEKIRAYLSQNGHTPAEMGLTAEQMQPGAEIDAITYYALCKRLNLPLEYFFKQEGGRP